MVRQVQPLRISKNTPSSSPNKMAAATSRPLSEIGSTERRRNSPSYVQATKKAIVSRESSPYTENSSPPSFLNLSKTSPRDFWSTRETMSPARFGMENSPERSPSPVASSPRRRPSVERLQQASRVKNSNIFALETKDSYDPNSLPIVERPSANRPLSHQLANNSFARADSMRQSTQKENNPFRSPQRSGHKRSETETNIDFRSPTKAAAGVPLPASPEKQGSPSPTKSSLSRNSQFGVNNFDPENGTWSDDERMPTPRALHRHAKSVTFHEEPPTVNEYEQQTPEPSVSAASDREGSWESDDFDDQDISFDRGSSADPERDDSFDADLENADKTPVVLPEHWSRMSPEEARMDLVDDKDDVFEDEHTQRPLTPQQSDRIASDSSDTRPLPPLPGFMRQERRGSDSLTSAAERAAFSPRNLPSPPKRASCSKDEIMKMTAQSSISLQDRLALRTAPEERPTSKSSSDTVHGKAEELPVVPVDTASSTHDTNVTEAEITEDSVVGDLSEFSAAPRISRESILRKVRSTKFDFEEDDGVDETEYLDETRPTIAELARMDPDQPIPSRENSRDASDNFGDPLRAETYLAYEEGDLEKIKEEPREDNNGFDMSAIPAAEEVAPPLPPALTDDYDRQSSVLRHGVREPSEDNDDSSSRYSSVEPDAESTMIHTTREETIEHNDGSKETLQDAMELLTVKDYSEPRAKDSEPTKQGSGDFTPLPAYLSTDDFDFGMKEYITPSPPASNENTQSKLEATTMPSLQAPFNFEPPRPSFAEADISPPDTPESVIHHHDDREISPIEGHEGPVEEPTEHKSTIIPERIASIKTGGKLKARPSATPADLQMMAEQRRIVSSDYPVPPIPAAYHPDPEIQEALNHSHCGAEDSSVHSTDIHDTKTDRTVEEEEQKPRRKPRKSGGRMDLDLDTSAFSIGGNDALGLDEEFERVIESQKVGTTEHPRSAGTDVYTSSQQKGYLMRQNTKVVVASNRNVSGESNGTAKSASSAGTVDEALPTSPTAAAEARPASSRSMKNELRKPSDQQFLKTEPWNGKMRRKSLRTASAQKTQYRNDPAPPLPGQESALGVVDEDYAAGSGSLEDDVGEGVERGRLFVKVVGVKNLDLPMPRNDRVDFQLTLDNGLHCVTTTSLELGKNAPIGQEFELVVLNDLEFQLTLTTKLPPPPAQPTTPTPSASPTKSIKSSKTSGFSRFLSSPKKRAEKERQEREALEAQERRVLEEERRKRASIVPNAWNLLHDLVNAQDGSFARAYINLKSHEKACFGRQLTVDVPCYNEWALEKDSAVVNSVRSKRGNAGPVRRPPYVVGQLELQLLYIPKPKGAGDEDMPKSMGGAVREMNKATDVKEVVYEGHLSQQGGDCVHWRRRFFRLQGPKLTAYHEHTHQKRAVINLSKASRLVDDKTTLMADPTSSPTKSKGRRKSAFAEEDEGYQYVEEGFRLRFANGETIDFYADNKERKEEWMVALTQVVGKADQSQKASRWTDLVLARERAEGGAGRPASSSDGLTSSSSPAKSGGTDVRDFTKPPAQPARQSSYRKPVVAPRLPSKSAPTSPAKQSPVKQGAPRAPPPATRPRTPPMKARAGHRSRDAVKSMIF